MSRYYNDGLYAVDTSTAELKHFGVKGQKWGRRNYQYEDGSLTPDGRLHYGVGERRAASHYNAQATDRYKKSASRRDEYAHDKSNYGRRAANRIAYVEDKYGTRAAKKQADREARNQALKILAGGAALAGAGAAYAAYKRGKLSVSAHNAAVNAQVAGKGLNEVKGGPILGFKAARQGNDVLNRMKDIRLNGHMNVGRALVDKSAKRQMNRPLDDEFREYGKEGAKIALYVIGMPIAAAAGGSYFGNRLYNQYIRSPQVQYNTGKSKKTSSKSSAPQTQKKQPN